MLIDIYFCFGIMTDEAGAAHIFATLIYFYIVNMFDVIFHAMKLLLYPSCYLVYLLWTERFPVDPFVYSCLLSFDIYKKFYSLSAWRHVCQGNTQELIFDHGVSDLFCLFFALEMVYVYGHIP